jgi:hypothetical protein
MHILPHGLIAGVKNMCTIGMDVDAEPIFRITVASNMTALVNNQALFAGIRCQAWRMWHHKDHSQRSDNHMVAHRQMMQRALRLKSIAGKVGEPYLVLLILVGL